MVSDTLRNLLKRYQALLTMGWVALTLSILLYVGIVYYILAPAGDLGPGPSYETLEFVFRLLALLLGIGSILWRRSYLSDERLRTNLAREVNARSLASNRQTGQVDEDRLLEIESLSEFEQKLFSLASRYHVSSFVSLSLNEAIAILGVVLGFLTGSPAKMVPFALAAIILNVLMFPRLTSLLDRASLLAPPEMPEGPATQFDRSIHRGVYQEDRLTTGAILALLGAVAYIVGHLMEGIRGDVVCCVGTCVFLCGLIMHDLRRMRK